MRAKNKKSCKISYFDRKCIKSSSTSQLVINMSETIPFNSFGIIFDRFSTYLSIYPQKEAFLSHCAYITAEHIKEKYTKSALEA